MLVTFDLLLNSPIKHREEIVMQMLTPECLLKHNIEYYNMASKKYNSERNCLDYRLKFLYQFTFFACWVEIDYVSFTATLTYLINTKLEKLLRLDHCLV